MKHATRTGLLFGFLYLAEGGPIGFAWWALPTLLRSAGFDLATITQLTATAVIPWTLKFLWAPIVERFAQEPVSLGRWVVGCQALLVGAFVYLAFLDPSQHAHALGPMLFLLAFLGSVQDIAVDGLAILTTPPSERGRLNGAMQLGLQVGRALMTGGALWISATSGWRGAVLFAAGYMAVCLLVAVVLLWRPRQAVARENESISISGLIRAAGRWTFLRAAAFALTGAAAFEVAGNLAGPMLYDAGVPEEQLGLIYSLGISLCLAVGGISAGPIVDRLGVLWSLRLTTIGFVVPIVCIASLQHFASASPTVLIACLAIMYFFVGTYTISSYAAFMGSVTTDIAPATQFTLLMSGTNLCEMWTVWLGGRWADQFGYGLALSAFAGLSVLALGWSPRDPDSGDG